LPRMAHTELRPHEGTLESVMAPIQRGLLVRFLTPRFVDVLHGRFSFYIDEAQEIVDGKPGAFIGPALLEGDGLTALLGIEAVGADHATFFGLKGCGKLNHGPLPVSFGNPSVRFGKMRVTPWM
jgi:TldD protein